MKTNVVILITFLLFCSACHKEEVDLLDPSLSVIGEYSGIKVYSHLDETNTMLHDTTNIVVTVTQGDEDSTIIIYSDPVYYEANNTLFKYVNGEWYSTITNHPPNLHFSNDSLFYGHCPGLAPNCTNMYTVKTSD